MTKSNCCSAPRSERSDQKHRALGSIHQENTPCSWYSEPSSWNEPTHSSCVHQEQARPTPLMDSHWDERSRYSKNPESDCHHHHLQNHQILHLDVHEDQQYVSSPLMQVQQAQ